MDLVFVPYQNLNGFVSVLYFSGLGMENHVMNNFVDGVDDIVKCPPRREQSTVHSDGSSSIPYLQGLDEDDDGDNSDDYVSI